MSDLPQVSVFEALAARLRGLPEPAHVVHLGCRSGTATLRLAGIFPEARITGVDASTDAVRQATRAARDAALMDRVGFERADLPHLPLADGSADMLVGVGIMGEVRHPVGVLNEIHRVLVPGGHGVLGELGAPPPVDQTGEPVHDLLSTLRASSPLEGDHLLELAAASLFGDGVHLRRTGGEGGPPVLLLTLHRAQEIR